MGAGLTHWHTLFFPRDGYNHLVGKAYNGIAAQVLLTLVHADLVRAAGFAAPDFPVFYNEMVGAPACAGDSEFCILT